MICGVRCLWWNPQEQTSTHTHTYKHKKEYMKGSLSGMKITNERRKKKNKIKKKAKETEILWID